MSTGVLKPQFTKGPLYAHGNGIWRSYDNYSVAFVTAHKPDLSEQEECASTARLFAAAPDLFELLRAGLEDGEPMNWDKVSDLLYSITNQK